MKDLALARDRISQLYNGEIFSKDVQEIAKERIDWITGQAEGYVLDVGCSEGILELLMAREGLNVIGIDINGSAIEYAKQLIKNESEETKSRIKFIESSVYDFDYKENSFDSLILTEVLEHLANPDRFLNICLKFLKPNGKIIITVPFSYHPDPDHRQTFTIAGFIDVIKTFFTPSHLDIKGKYIRCLGRKDEFEKDFNYEELLKLSESNFLEIHKKFHGINHEYIQKIKNLNEEIALEKKIVNSIESLKTEDKIFFDLLKESELHLEKKIVNSIESLKTEDKIFFDLLKKSELHLDRIDSNMKEHLDISDTKLCNISSDIEKYSGQQILDRTKLTELLNDINKQQQYIEKKLEVIIDETQNRNLFLKKFIDVNQLKQKYIIDSLNKIYRKQFDDAKKIDLRLNDIFNWISSSKKDQKILRKNKTNHTVSFKKYNNFRTSSFSKITLLIKVGFIKGLKHPIKFIFFLTSLLINLLLHPTKIKQTIYDMYQYICLGREDIRVPGNKKVYEKYLKERNERLRKEEEKVSIKPEIIPIDVSRAKKNIHELKIGVIMDVFTKACFEPECQIITFRPDNWKSKLEKQNIDFLFVESAWAGNSGSWQYRIASYASPPDNELYNLLKWCHGNQIPTVFWNKEDPPNFNRFIETASKFDYIFTTDANCVELYKENCGHDRIFVLPFAAQPKIHNPINSTKREKEVSFAGTYYADCFEDRKADMDALLDGASSFALEIFDRKHGYTGSDRERFLYPERFQKFIKGRLEYNEMVDAYRKYQVFLNVNSVNDSPTMFSRRVFELLACGTPVVSTQCKGIDNYFNKLVPQVSSKKDSSNEIKLLIENKKRWKKISALGLRKVMKEHTYSHRLKHIMKSIGFTLKQDSQKIIVVIIPNTKTLKVIEDLHRQSVKIDKILVIDNKYSKSILECFNKVDLESKIISLKELDWLIKKDYQEEYIAFIDTCDRYGPNYLLDASLALNYGQSNVNGMSSCYSYDKNKNLIFNNTLGEENSWQEQFYLGTLIMVGNKFNIEFLSNCRNGIIDIKSRGFSRYSFEYIKNGSDQVISNEILSNIFINEGGL